ncbi:MAG TPA: DUF333 domain-containing protein [Anaerolineae bacterium]|nr:DUF333 domain-containing protein [Anaerolineae bacterium]
MEVVHMRQFITLSSMLLFALIWAACAQPGPSDGSLPSPTIDQAKLANPAANYCVDQGFRYESRKDAQGNAYGVCIFDDGTECDAWAYYRGECGQGQAKNLVLNVVEATGLEGTEKIEIVHIRDGKNQSIVMITDPETIQALVESLNTTLPLIPPKRCPAIYLLHFTLKNGQTRTFKLGLSGLYGDQDYWKGMAITPPDAFAKIFNKLVESSR